MKIQSMEQYFQNADLRVAITAGQKGEVPEGLFAFNLMASKDKNKLIPVYLKAIQDLSKDHSELAVRLVHKFKIEYDKQKELPCEEIQKLWQEAFAPYQHSVDARKEKKEAQTKIATELFGKNAELLHVLLYGKRANKGYATWKDFAKNIFRIEDQKKRGEMLVAYKAILADKANAEKYPEVIEKLCKKLKKQEKLHVVVAEKVEKKEDDKKEEKPLQK